MAKLFTPTEWNVNVVRAINIALTVVVFGIFGFIVVLCMKTFGQPTFHKMQVRLKDKGQAVIGEKLAEFGSVCSDEAGKPHSCDALVYSINNPQPIVAKR